MPQTFGKPPAGSNNLWHYGNGPPAGVAHEGDSYLDTTNHNMWLFRDFAWHLLGQGTLQKTKEEEEDEDEWGPRVCLDCGDLLLWNNERLPTPGYMWKRSNACRQTQPNSYPVSDHGHTRGICLLSLFLQRTEQELDTIEKNTI